MPLTQTLSCWWKGEKEDEKILTMPPHPCPLPRWGEGACREREELKEYPPHPYPLPLGGEGKKEKDLTAPLTFILSRKGREE
jgi:hypothetical protein